MAIKMKNTNTSRSSARDYCNQSLHVIRNLSLVGLLACTALITACETTPENPNADLNVTAEEVAEQTEAVTGQTVTIRSDVQAKVGKSAFTLDNKGEDILVVNITGEPFVLPEDNRYKIQATGEVGTFVLADIEKKYRLGLDPELYAEFETKPTLLAQSLKLAPEPGDITQQPERFYDLEIAVEGEVEQVIDAKTFTLDEEQLFGATDLLVIGTPVAATLEGERVTITGKLRKFILSEFERDYDLTWDLKLKEKLEVEYTEKPVFVAEALYPTAQ